MTSAEQHKIWKGPESLYWIIPVMYGILAVILFLSLALSAHPEKWTPLIRFTYPVFFISPFGTLWALFQCLRYEKNYVALCRRSVRSDGIFLVLL
jgi:hypothetical protein